MKKDDWDRKIKQLVNKMESYDRIVTKRWRKQIKKDIRQKLAAWHGRSNSNFAKRLYDFLSEKFDWRDWHIVAYNKLKGGSRHWVKWCGGYKSFRKHGRNLVVASLDNGRKRINKKAAAKKLDKVPTRYKKLNSRRGTRTYNRKAEDIYKKHFPRKFRSGCTYAAAGVIEKNAGVAHRAPAHRLVVRNNGKFKLHVFG